MSLRIFAGLMGLFLSLPGWARDPISYTTPQDQRHSIVLVLWNGDTTDPQLETYLNRIRTAGAKHVTVPYFGCQTDANSSDVGECNFKPQPVSARAARLAKKMGLTVSLLPIVLSYSGEWRGFFNPKDPVGWFANYTTWIKKVAAFARELESPDLVVGSEFGPIYKFTESWNTLLRELRAHDFSRPLVMTVNWDMPNVGFWDETDAIGVSHYFPLASTKNPTEHELQQGALEIKKKLWQWHQSHRRPIHLTEVGYPSFVGAAAMPWGVPPEAQKPVMDWNIQSACYRAFTQTWKGASELVHVGFWATGETFGQAHDYGYEFMGKPAQSWITNFLQSR